MEDQQREIVFTNGEEEPQSDVEDEAFIDPQDVVQEVDISEADREKIDFDEDMEEESSEQGQTEGQSDTPQGPDDSFSRFVQHTDSIYSIALHPTHEVAITGGGDDKAYLWKVSDGSPIFELSGHTDSIGSVKFNTDGKLVATGSLDGTVKVWDVQTGKLVQSLEGPTESIECINWHPKGNVIVAGTQGGSIWMWMSSGQYMNVFNGHKGQISHVGFTNDGKQLLSSSEDGTVRVWSPKTAETTVLFQGHGFHGDAVTSLATHPKNDNIIGSTSVDGTLVISNIASGKPVAGRRDHTDSVETVSFCADHPYVATGSLDKQVLLYDLSTMQLRAKCEHEDGVVKVQWHPTQALLFSCSMDKTVRLWDGRVGSAVKVWRGHQAGILDMALSSDGAFVATAGDDHASLIFKV